MLEGIQIQNFKAFRELVLPLRPLTLLTGLNGMGKSTVIQALLLLRQSYDKWPLLEGESSRHFTHSGLDSLFPLVLNGSLIQLGTNQDVLCRHVDQNFISIALQMSSTGSSISSLDFHFEFIESEQYYALDPSVFEFVQWGQWSLAQYVPLFGSNFQYLQAERMGPRTTFDIPTQTRSIVNTLGTRGEYAAHFLNYWSLRADKPLVVQEGIKHPNSDSSTLNTQVTAWMSEISPDTKIETQPIEGTDLIRLRFGFGDSDYFRPTNVGFGLTYTLPVVIALVSAQPGSLILVENPEAHLHPKGQAQLGNLIARAADAGAQVILETHSDHILNGIRIAVRNGFIEAKDVALHYFQRASSEKENTLSEVISPIIDKNGKLSIRPEGFFDEFDRALDELL